MSQQLTADREDGTPLRAKATPNGKLSYLVGKLISVSGSLVTDLAIFLVPAMFLVPGLTVTSLGMLAALPIGAVLGSLFRRGR